MNGSSAPLRRIRSMGAGMKQATFSGLEWLSKRKVTRRDRFPSEMDAVIPWSRLRALIEPHYPTAGQGRPPIDAERMLRDYFLQQWFSLSDPQAEDSPTAADACAEIEHV